MALGEPASRQPRTGDNAVLRRHRSARHDAKADAGTEDKSVSREKHARLSKPPPDPEAEHRATRRRWLIGGAVVLLLLVAGGWYGWHYYTVGRYLISTDDAYTEADSVTLSSQVAGSVSELRVTDNQTVHRGDVIALIDQRTYSAQVDQARADLDASVANIHNVDAQIEEELALVAQSDAAVGSARATLAFAQQERDRFGALAKTGAGSVERAQQALTTFQEKQAALVQATASYIAEQKKVDVLRTQKEQVQAASERAKAAVEQAEVSLGYATIVAPVDGVVGDRSVRMGQYVQPGMKLLTIVPMEEVYVVANFKETQLDRMHPGQAVEMSVDAYPGVTLHGHVNSLAPGSGSQFALLPPENATGNFTKIVQRVPVKIDTDANDPLRGRIRPGLSVVPTVDTRDTKGQKLQERPLQTGLTPP